MTHPRVLIACIGNIFLGDDGFGTEVARRLAQRELPPGVVVRDFGIRGFDLTYALLDPYKLVILVDACPRGGKPGTLYLIEPDLSRPGEDDSALPAVETHGMNPMAVLRVVRSLGGPSARVLVVGCEPADLGSDDGKLGLSTAVEAAIDGAIQMIEDMIERFCDAEPAETSLERC
jgi:hydrogenase maturation protease